MANDPTANLAIGMVTREWKQMTRLAKRIRNARDLEWADRESQRFTGIFKRLLTETDEEVAS